MSSTSDSSPSGRQAADDKILQDLRVLEEKFARELMDVEDRCELEDQVRRLRRRIASEATPRS